MSDQQRFVTRAELYSSLSGVFFLLSAACVVQTLSALEAHPFPAGETGCSFIVAIIKWGGWNVSTWGLALGSLAYAIWYRVLSVREQRRHAPATPMPSEPLPQKRTDRPVEH
jgi:hypothetical protein